MGSILENLEKQGRLLAPSFVFIDPFGFTGIPMSLIKNIVTNKRCEVFINFMIEELNRFLVLPQNEAAITETFGSDDWKKFKDVPNRESMLIAHYRDQLEKYAGIKYVRTFTIVNRHNKSDYYLVFGTNSETGLSKMKDAMWKVDPSGSFRFSDATYNSSQPLLFEDIPDFNRLNKSIIEKYKGLEVLVDDLESFVNIETSFRKEHLRTVLKKMEKVYTKDSIVVSGYKYRYESCVSIARVNGNKIIGFENISGEKPKEFTSEGDNYITQMPYVIDRNFYEETIKKDKYKNKIEFYPKVYLESNNNCLLVENPITISEVDYEKDFQKLLHSIDTLIDCNYKL